MVNASKTYTYLLNNDQISLVVQGTINGQSKTDAMINLIRSNKDIRQYLHSKYYTDCAILEEIFCDPLSNYSDSLKKYYKYNDRFGDVEFDDLNAQIEFIDKLPSDTFSDTDVENLKEYYQNITKYETLVGAFWVRNFENLYTDLNHECFTALANKEIQDNDIVLT